MSTMLDNLKDIKFLDQLADEAARVAQVTPNTTWRVNFEQLATAARGLANARRRASTVENA